MAYQPFPNGKVAPKVDAKHEQGYINSYKPKTDHHNILDAVGMVEVVGTSADGLNAAIYKFEGKDFEAKILKQRCQ